MRRCCRTVCASSPASAASSSPSAAPSANTQNTVERVGVNASIHTPGQSAPGYTMLLDGLPVHDDWHYRLKQGDNTLQEGAGTAATLLDALDLRVIGLDPKTILQNEQQQFTSAGIVARRGALHMSGEDIECYIVTVHHGELFETTIFVSPLGQVLAVRTSGGYDLYDETLTP